MKKKGVITALARFKICSITFPPFYQLLFHLFSNGFCPMTFFPIKYSVNLLAVSLYILMIISPPQHISSVGKHLYFLIAWIKEEMKKIMFVGNFWLIIWKIRSPVSCQILILKMRLTFIGHTLKVLKCMPSNYLIKWDYILNILNSIKYYIHKVCNDNNL